MRQGRLILLAALLAAGLAGCGDTITNVFLGDGNRGQQSNTDNQTETTTEGTLGLSGGG